MEIEILEQQCGGTEFVPSPHRGENGLPLRGRNPV